MNLCRRCVVTGRVQGVWFRANTREQAQRLGVDGYVRNLADGGVEVLACGAPEAVEALSNWLRRGPPMAEVRMLDCEEIPLDPDASGFTIR